MLFQETKILSTVGPLYLQFPVRGYNPKQSGLLLVESVDAKPEDTECQLYSFHCAVYARSLSSWGFGLYWDS